MLRPASMRQLHRLLLAVVAVLVLALDSFRVAEASRAASLSADGLLHYHLPKPLTSDMTIEVYFSRTFCGSIGLLLDTLGPSASACDKTFVDDCASPICLCVRYAGIGKMMGVHANEAGCVPGHSNSTNSRSMSGFNLWTNHSTRAVKITVFSQLEPVSFDMFLIDEAPDLQDFALSSKLPVGRVRLVDQGRMTILQQFEDTKLTKFVDTAVATPWFNIVVLLVALLLLVLLLITCILTCSKEEESLAVFYDVGPTEVLGGVQGSGRPFRCDWMDEDGQ